MPKNNEVSFGEYFNLPNPGLKSYFDRVRSGNTDEYRTTFFRGRSLDSILKAWKPTLDKIENDWPTLLDFENDLAKKVGPLSIQKPLAERLDDIESYYESISLDSEPISRSAIAAVIAEWGDARGIQLRGQRKTVDNMKKSTNSGSPFFTKRRAVVDKTIPARLDYLGVQTKQFLNNSDWYSAAVLGWRGQEGGPTDEDVKQRVVWMFPFGVNVKELQFYQPAIEIAQKRWITPAWIGMEAVDQRITKLFDTKAKSELVICTDFSKFDQHFNKDMQDAARTIIAALLNGSSESRDWLDNVFPVKYAIPLAMDMGVVKTGFHGMGSGSGGTNFDETLTHRALQYEAAQKAKSVLNPNSQCLGDDGILSYPGITVEDVTRSYSAHGQEMNIDKQYASAHDCTYLRRWHHDDYRVDGVCVGVYATYRALGRLCEQERYYDPEVWGPKMVALRQLSIIENCKYHPLREEFVNFCMKGDKYRLGLDIPGFLDNIEKLAMEATDLMPDFLGYTKSLGTSGDRGIGQWWVVNYLKSLR
ncbi:RNA-dependent RNA polymerase [Human picobirnavirus]|uniref:RNA-dependent RNA polymerase n=1 Tax=Human picobirnavirus TaxID=145856 RepID=Q99H56_HPBV|nr:RNA-dependent RNA polymerase [Human picobirnavirus]